MMNGMIRGRKGIRARLWMGLFCMTLAVLGMLGMTDDQIEQPTLRVENQGDSWKIHISTGLVSLTRGETMALLLEVDVPEGWEVSSVERAEGAEGLSLTVGADEDVLKLLLDGMPEQDGEALVTLKFRATAGETPTVMGKDGVVMLYCMGEDGSIRRIPLLIQEDMEDTADEGTTASETVSQEVCTEECPVEPPTIDWDSPMETAIDDPFLDEIPKKSPLFGCQETPAQNGLYAVRFWILGGDGAVICAEGGGVLLLEVTREGKWNHVTFRGMRGEKKYVFFVYSSEGIVRVVYENGIFKGFEKIEAALFPKNRIPQIP